MMLYDQRYNVYVSFFWNCDDMEQTNLNISGQELAKFCERWQISELALFGSVVRDDFRPDSAVDVLVQFAPQAHWTLLDFVAMQDDLSTLLGRKVDLVMRNAVESSPRAQRRKRILDSAQVIYVT
jgi:predicted nucleotidyltransferase